MITCERCSVSLSGSPELCPLCQGNLSGTPDFRGNVFPNIPMNNSYNSLFKTVSASVITLSIFLFAISFMFPEIGGFAMVAIVVLACMWLSFCFIMKNKKKIPKNIFFQVIFLSLLAESLDSYMGYSRWAITYFIPIIVSCAIITISILAITRKMYIGDYVIYLLLLSFIGIIGFRFLISSEITMRIPMGICFAISCSAVLLLMMFRRREIYSEIQRRLHF